MKNLFILCLLILGVNTFTFAQNQNLNRTCRQLDDLHLSIKKQLFEHNTSCLLARSNQVNLLLQGNTKAVNYTEATFLNTELSIKKKKNRAPWFYFGSGLAAAGSVYANMRIDEIYDNQYMPESSTDGAGEYNKQIRDLEMIRNVALGTAGVLGTIGVVVHIKHRNSKNRVTMNYLPQKQGAEFALTLNF